MSDIRRWIPELHQNFLKQSKNEVFTKTNLKNHLLEIKKMGWITISKHRRDKDGGLGNTLEDLLGIPENNIPLADYGIFELKTHRSKSNSLISLFRVEPRPRSRKNAIIPNMIKNYGWPLPKYGPKELSLRVDIDAKSYSERGFIIKIDYDLKRVELHFNATKVPKKQPYIDWLKIVNKRIGLSDLNPIPFWTFEDLEDKIRGKIKNMVYISLDTASKNSLPNMKISKASLLQNASLINMLKGIKDGWFQIELSARTHHNHGTAFRTWERNWPLLYENVERLV